MPTFACPGCGRPLYNRRRAACEFCGRDIPTNLRLSPIQQGRVEAMKLADRRRRQDSSSFGGGSGGGDVGSFDAGGGSGCDGGGCDGGCG